MILNISKKNLLSSQSFIETQNKVDQVVSFFEKKPAIMIFDFEVIY